MLPLFPSPTVVGQHTIHSNDVAVTFFLTLHENTSDTGPSPSHLMHCHALSAIASYPVDVFMACIAWAKGFIGQPTRAREVELFTPCVSARRRAAAVLLTSIVAHGYLFLAEAVAEHGRFMKSRRLQRAISSGDRVVVQAMLTTTALWRLCAASVVTSANNDSGVRATMEAAHASILANMRTTIPVSTSRTKAKSRVANRPTTVDAQAAHALLQLYST
jgi:hypothetical protein